MRTLAALLVLSPLLACTTDDLPTGQPSGGAAGGKSDDPSQSVAVADIGNADVRRALAVLDVDADGLLTTDDLPSLDDTEFASARAVWSSYLIPSGPPTVYLFQRGTHEARVHVGDTVGVRSNVLLADRSEVGRGYVIVKEEKLAGSTSVGSPSYTEYQFRFVEPGTYHIAFPVDWYSSVQSYDVTVLP